MGEKLLSMLTWMLVGYLLGMTAGFALVDPNTDIYALAGAVLAILGLLLGLIPFLRKRTRLALGGITGFYLGSMLAILLLGAPAKDDLMEVALDGRKLLVALIAAIVGIVLVQRLAGRINNAILAAFLFGGFFGGLLFTATGIAPRLSMVGTAPYFLGCGIVCAAVVWWLQRRNVIPKPL